MATEASQPLKLSLEASGNLLTSQYNFVKRDANGRATAVTAATDTPVGILQNRPLALGQMAEIVVIGISKCVTTTTGTAFTTYSDGVAPDATGAAQKASGVGFSAAYVQGTKSLVGKLAVFGGIAAGSTGTNAGVPNAGDMTRVFVDCSTPPTPAT